METMDTNKVRLLIDVLNDYFNATMNDRCIKREFIVRLALSVDKEYQLYNLIIHNLDNKLAKKNINLINNAKYYFKNNNPNYNTLTRCMYYVDRLFLSYDTIANFISMSKDEAIEELNNYLR